MVEKVAATLVGAHCETTGCFHPGQYGCRTRRSAVDAVGVAIVQTLEAWQNKRIAGALLMDVAAAFPNAACGCLLQKMRAMDIGECLVAWTDSFMRDRRVIMSVDGGRRVGMRNNGPSTKLAHLTGAFCSVHS